VLFRVKGTEQETGRKRLYQGEGKVDRWSTIERIDLARPDCLKNGGAVAEVCVLRDEKLTRPSVNQVGIGEDDITGTREILDWHIARLDAQDLKAKDSWLCGIHAHPRSCTTRSRWACHQGNDHEGTMMRSYAGKMVKVFPVVLPMTPTVIASGDHSYEVVNGHVSGSNNTFGI
jgi:hypothetical protein